MGENATVWSGISGAKLILRLPDLEFSNLEISHEVNVPSIQPQFIIDIATPKSWAALASAKRLKTEPDSAFVSLTFLIARN